MNIHTSAPGKIVLCGEYAVLDGAPAIVIAVDRRASVRISESKTGSHVVACSGYDDGQYPFELNDEYEFAWTSASPDFSLLEQLWQSTSGPTSPELSILLDTESLFDPLSGRKLGLGSSAALSVALLAAFASFDEKSTDLDEAVAIHRLIQGGRGSGIDVAAAICGGVTEYRMGETAYARRLDWPAMLEYAVLWSGSSSSTEQKIAAFDRSTERHDSRDQLATASAEIVAAWPAAEIDDLISMFSEYTQTLIQFSNDHDLGVFDGGHSELVTLAADHGVVYKPCGAGGGDVGIVLSANRRAVAEFVTAAAEFGFRRLQLNIDPVGLITDRSK